MRNPLEAIANASNENLAAPNGAVITVARAVKTDADNARVPRITFSEDGRNVSAVMLDRYSFGRGKLTSMNRGSVLRMGVMNYD